MTYNKKVHMVEISNDTLSIIRNGGYTSPNGISVDILADIEFTLKNTHSFKPQFVDQQKDNVKTLLNEKNHKTIIEVTDETTMVACQRLSKEKTACLNFASAKNPGGGFLSGSVSQEEALSRASSLYPSIKRKTDYYEHNKSLSVMFYSDYMIYSPGVTFFRDDKHQLLEEPFNVNIITSPAVNLSHAPHTTELLDMVDKVMLKRIDKILGLALLNDNETLVLGAFGCGVFKNNPYDIASYFKTLLSVGGKYENKFKRVTFAVPNFSKVSEINYRAFRRIFAQEVANDKER